MVEAGLMYAKVILLLTLCCRPRPVVGANHARRRVPGGAVPGRVIAACGPLLAGRAHQQVSEFALLQLLHHKVVLVAGPAPPGQPSLLLLGLPRRVLHLDEQQGYLVVRVRDVRFLTRLECTNSIRL